MSVITRFAPSPTGSFHIGSARTALFNYLFARSNNGKFLLRIEDTDIQRSTQKAIYDILNSMKWLGLDHDGEIIFQSARKVKHQEAVNKLIKKGKAYFCFSSQKEIAVLRAEAIARKQQFIFNSPWKNVSSDKYPVDIKPVVRLKTLKEGVTIIKDLLQNDIAVDNSQLDDMVLLRSDGTPTYMLAVVVDDNDMGITHIIRGDDHLTNTHRQQVLYEALGYKIPAMIHIPLVHGPDGTKLSKRHGAVGTEKYKEMGYLPEALCNYLLRLGWSHGNDEIISRDQAIRWFSIQGLGKSAARLDFSKMKSLNAYYLRKKDNLELAKMVIKMIEKHHNISRISKENIFKAMNSMKSRVQLLSELKEMAMMYVIDMPISISDGSKQIILKTDNKLLKQVGDGLSKLKIFSKYAIKKKLEEIAGVSNLSISELMYYIRAFIAGNVNSPSIFEMMEILGLEQSLKRLRYDQKLFK